MIMKKLVTVFALCAAFSAYAQVESANIVGYNTSSVAAGKIQAAAAQFQAVGAASGNRSLNIADIPFPTPAKSGASLGTNVDQIHVWNAVTSSWTKYYRNTTAGWCKEGETTTTTDTLNVGEGYFFRRALSALGSETVTGQVFNGTNVTYTLAAAKIQNISYPWPVELKIADIPAPTPLRAGAILGTNTDQIHVWDTTLSAWTKYYRNSTAGWCKEGETTQTTDVIAVGQAMFIRRAASAPGTLELAKPVGL
jgi:hypothetical protein